jgi:hypothetical protein
MNEVALEADLLRELARTVREGILAAVPTGDEYLRSQLLSLYSFLKHWSAFKADHEGNSQRRAETGALLGTWVEQLGNAGCDKEARELEGIISDMADDTQLVLESASAWLGKLSGRVALDMIAVFRQRLRQLIRKHNEEFIEQLVNGGNRMTDKQVTADRTKIGADGK